MSVTVKVTTIVGFWTVVIILMSGCIELSASESDAVEMQQQQQRHHHRSEILYSLAEMYDDNLEITEKCKIDLKHVIDGVQKDELWALKLLDASGRREAGFVWGNNFWLGSKKACDIISAPISLYLSKEYMRISYENLTEGESRIPVEYRMVYARHMAKLQVDIQVMDRKILHIGFCFPQSCTNEDTMVLTSTLFANANYTHNNFLSRNTTALSTKVLEIRDNFFNDTFFLIMISMFTVNMVCVVIGTIFVAVMTHNRKLMLTEISTGNREGLAASSETSLKPNALEKFLKCFSIMENSKLICSHNMGRESIGSIHGMRAFGMVYIIVGHMFVYTVSGANNFEMLFIYMKIILLQPIVAVTLAVDTFLLISALLLSYMFFQRLKADSITHPAMATIKGIVNRYLRLTPSYIVVLVIMTVTAKLLTDTSQIWSLENNDENCTKYWWRNLLYINNFYSRDEMCMSWSWYLSVDFQCFVLATILLNLYRVLPKTSITIFVAIFMASTAFNGYAGYQHKFAFSLDAQWNSMDDLYTPTSARIGPYFVGILAGWILSAYKSNKQLKLGKKTVITLWIVAPLINLSLIFLHGLREMPVYLSVIYPAIGKTLWAVGIAWTLIACKTGHGGIIAKVLNIKHLIPFSRMSYTAYLLNPLLIIFVVMSTDASYHLDFSSLIIQAFGFVVVSFILSFVFMLIFENPFIMLIRTYVERTIKD